MKQQMVDRLGPPIGDADEETFLLFSQNIPSSNLGFVNDKAPTLEFSIDGRDYEFNQSPGLLHSNLSTGTTGAVIWKITPILAAWLASSPAWLRLLGIVDSASVIVELGCGITGLIGLVMAPKVSKYILTDQQYVMKTLQGNISSNAPASKAHSSKRKSRTKDAVPIPSSRLPITMVLDWEKDSAENLNAVVGEGNDIDLVIICDCVYNDFLIVPLVQTCVDMARLRTNSENPTLFLIAQQLRSDTIFGGFLTALMEAFMVWRLDDHYLSTELSSKSGFVVHVAIIR